MQAHRQTRTLLLSIAILGWTVSSTALGQWYAGTWDSRFKPVLDHPWTVAIRMELLDRDTHIPVSGVQVSLEGQYYQMWINRDTALAQDVSWWNLFVDPNKREPQPREFRLNAVSGSDGVVVFALQWQKEFPWDSYFDGHPPRDYKPNGSWTEKESWLLAVDDIEKVQRLEIRHERYRYIEAPLNFEHVVSLEQYLSPQRVVPDKYKLFEQNWKNEIRRRNVRMFVLDLGTGFPEFKNQSCTRPEFFSRIRAKDYGEVYQVLENLPQSDEGKKCGPYFVYDLGEILLEPVASRIEMQGATSSILTQDAQRQGTPWYRQYSREAVGADAHSRQETGPGQTTDAGAATAPLDRQTMALSAESLPSVQDILRDPARLRDIAGKAGVLKDQLAVAGIRALPFPDPDTGQMTTFDTYARRLAANAGVGGSLGEDPVATAYAMLLNSNFLSDQARIVQLPNGEYATLNEAITVAAADSNSGLDPAVLRKTVTAMADLQQAQRIGEVELLSKAATMFAGAVSGANDTTGNVLPAWATPSTQSTGSKPPAGPAISPEGGLYCPELSMSLKTLTPELRKEFGLYTGVEGAVIVGIDGDAPPGNDDLKLGIVVCSLGRTLIATAEDLAQEARRVVSNPATVRGSGRDQALLGFWRWNGTSWERGSEMIWVVGKGQVNASGEQSSQAHASGGLPQRKTIDLGNGVSMEFVLIPAGTFYMGSPGSEKDRDGDEGPVRRVQITRAFYLGKYEVTQDQYMAVMGRNPSNFSGRNLPVEQVSWDEAVAFCRKIGGRLPTEAEWEYACRAGSETRFCYGDDLNYAQLSGYAWYDANSGKTTHAVGQKKPNSFGLHDMHGNVWEWCQDWYAENYQNATGVDPKGPSSGITRVVRGGSWVKNPRGCRSANRSNSAPGYRYSNFGFRVALD